MSLIPLPLVQTRLRPSTPLPWDILNDKGHVLWSRGDLLSASQFVSVGMGRSLYADSTDVLADATATCERNAFFPRWDAWGVQLALLLRQSAQPGFLAKIREVAQALVALAAFDADKMLFAVMRHDHSQFSTYGVIHSQHVAALCALLTQSMGWPTAQRVDLACAALTMNLSIVEMQGALAASGGRLTAAQRAQVRRHPEDSSNLLRQAGLVEGPWLMAVTNHHERADGTGYPRQLVEVDAFSRVIHVVDVFAAKHAARFDRLPLSAAEAVRLLQREPQSEAVQLAAAMGAYPPGCFVRLVTGEAAVVLRRAVPRCAGPVLAVLQDPQKQMLPRAYLRQAPLDNPGISHALDDSALLVRLDPEDLYSQAALSPVA